jgi:hypothetical protein
MAKAAAPAKIVANVKIANREIASMSSASLRTETPFAGSDPKLIS